MTRARQDINRALANLETLLYMIPSSGEEVSFRFHDGRIEWRRPGMPHWAFAPIDYGEPK